MADECFRHPRLAAVYDQLDPDRRDLDPYLRTAEETGARHVLDVGCGTGVFALLLSGRGIEVTGVDPAQASLDVARRKPGGERVRWIQGDATTLPSLTADLATMTGNAAQEITGPEDWQRTLRGIRAALRPGGRLVFESRIPARRAWEEWNREATYGVTEVAGAGAVESWVDLLDVSGPLVTFRWTYVFAADGQTLTSDSTLRFRERQEVEAALAAQGYVVEDVRDAPDRPGREFVFVARRPETARRGGPADSAAHGGRPYNPRDQIGGDISGGVRVETIIVQLPGTAQWGEVETGSPELIHLGPGDIADFGRGGAGVRIVLPDPGISRRAGQLEAAGDYWRLSNFSRSVSYVVENLEGAGEYLTVAPGRLGAPVPFEFSRVVLPALSGTATFKVFAPQHAYLGEQSVPGGGEQTVHPFALDPTSKYFLVLVALCEPRLRDPSDSALPGVGQIVERLRSLESCRDLTRSAVNYHIDYLAFAKLRLDLGEEAAAATDGGRTGAKRTRLASVALRFGLVREEHLGLLPPRGAARLTDPQEAGA